MEINIPSVLVEQRLHKILIQKSMRGRRVYTEPTTKKRTHHTIGRPCYNGSYKKIQSGLKKQEDFEKESEGSPISESVGSTSSETDEARL
jgi:hypothetical protein